MKYKACTFGDLEVTLSRTRRRTNDICPPLTSAYYRPEFARLLLQLGVMTKGTVIEVNVSDLGLVTQSGKVVWGKYAQVTNSPELDGCINAVLLV